MALPSSASLTSASAALFDARGTHVHVTVAGHQPLRLQRQRLHVDVLDLPAAGHLLDDELGVHPHLELGVRGVLAHELEPGDEAAVLGDVVRGDADGLAALGDHLAGVGVAHEGAVGGRAGVAARAAVGLDDDASRSQAGLGRADEDAAALGAAQHLVVGLGRDLAEVGPVDLEPAALAPARPQRGRTPARRTAPAPCRTGPAGRPGPAPTIRSRSAVMVAVSASMASIAESRADGDVLELDLDVVELGGDGARAASARPRAAP